MADLLWPGDERAGDLFSDAALLEAMVDVESAWLAAGATSRRICAASHAEVQMTTGVLPSSCADVFRRMLTWRVRRRHAIASISCCIPPAGATTPFFATRDACSRVPNRSEALSDAGSPA